MRIKPDDLPAFQAAVRRVGDTYPLDEAIAASRLGPYFRKGGTYFDVPDGPFPEAELIQLARDDAAGQGTAVIEVETAVRLESDGQGIVSVVANGVKLEADEVIIAAGCGTPSLLDQLGIAHDLEVVRTPLLVVKHSGRLPVSLLVDRVAGFSVTQPEPERLVFGVRGQLPTKDPTDPAEREAKPEEREELRERFCVASGFRLPDNECRAHAGLEIQLKRPMRPDGATGDNPVEPIAEKVRREVLPILGSDTRFRNLRWALPGRATLALSVARKVVAALTLSPRARASIGVGSPWQDDIEMFYRPSYD